MEFLVFAAIIFAIVFGGLFILVCLSEGMGGEDFVMTIVMSSLLTLFMIVAFTIASNGSKWIQENYLEPEPPAIERINLEKE